MKGVNKVVSNLITRLTQGQQTAVLSTKLKKNLIVYKDKTIWFNKQYLMEHKNMRELLCIYSVLNLNKNKKYCAWPDLINTQPCVKGCN